MKVKIKEVECAISDVSRRITLIPLDNKGIAVCVCANNVPSVR